MYGFHLACLGPQALLLCYLQACRRTPMLHEVFGTSATDPNFHATYVACVNTLFIWCQNGRHVHWCSCTRTVGLSKNLGASEVRENRRYWARQGQSTGHKPPVTSCVPLRQILGSHKTPHVTLNMTLRLKTEARLLFPLKSSLKGAQCKTRSTIFASLSEISTQ